MFDTLDLAEALPRFVFPAPLEGTREIMVLVCDGSVNLIQFYWVLECGNVAYLNNPSKTKQTQQQKFASRYQKWNLSQP